MFHSKIIFFTSLLFLFLTFSLPVLGQSETPKTATEILKEIERITTKTNWTNEAAAERAAKRLEELGNILTNSPPSKEEDSEESQQEEELPFDINPQEIANSAVGAMAGSGDEGIDRRKKELYQKLIKIGLSGEEYPDMDMAQPVRDDIVEEYQEEEKKYLHPGLFKELEILIIDFSDPKSVAIIPKIASYSEIKTLILTGGKNHAEPISLASVLTNCKSMKLQELYIINFQNHLTQLPEFALDHSQLIYLGLFNNQLTVLPQCIYRFGSLKTLHLDKNPLEEISRLIGNLTKLTELGIAGTQIKPDRIESLKRQLPNCKIMEK